MLSLIQGYDLVTKRLNNIIWTLKAHPNILIKEDQKSLYPVYEKMMYIAISASDLNIALKYLDVSNAIKNGYEASYFARNVAHIAYELINHRQKIVGQEVAELAIKTLGADALKDIKEAGKELHDVCKEHKEKLNYIRNNLFGHRNVNGSELAKGMIAIDNSEIFTIGKRVLDVHYDVLSKYVELLGKL